MILDLFLIKNNNVKLDDDKIDLICAIVYVIASKLEDKYYYNLETAASITRNRYTIGILK